MDYPSFCRIPSRSRKKFIEIANEWYETINKSKSKNPRR